MTIVHSLGNLNNYKDLLFEIFMFLTPKENVKNTEVCKQWKEVASVVAKKQFIQEKEKCLREKMANFLVLSGGNFEDFVPVLQQIKTQQQQLSIKTVFDQLNSLTEQYTICLGGCFIVDANCPNIPKNKQIDLAGKAFAEFHFKQEGVLNCDGKSYCARLFSEESYGGGITYFPVELFNFKVEADGTITGEKNSGGSCFSLKGRLIEVFLIEGDQNIRDARWACPLISRDKALTIQLTPEDANSGYVWPQDIYVARLDAKAANNSQDQSNQ